MILGIVLTGVIKKVKVYEVFCEGAKEGFTTAVRIIPVPGKKAGERVVFGGLLGETDIININNLDCSVLINRGGKVAPPIQALKN